MSIGFMRIKLDAVVVSQFKNLDLAVSCRILFYYQIYPTSNDTAICSRHYYLSFPANSRRDVTLNNVPLRH